MTVETGCVQKVQFDCGDNQTIVNVCYSVGVLVDIQPSSAGAQSESKCGREYIYDFFHNSESLEFDLNIETEITGRHGAHNFTECTHKVCHECLVGIDECVAGRRPLAEGVAHGRAFYFVNLQVLKPLLGKVVGDAHVAQLGLSAVHEFAQTSVDGEGLVSVHIVLVSGVEEGDRNGILDIYGLT